MPMKLIVSATEHEVKPLLKGKQVEHGSLVALSPEVSLLVTGVGAAATAFHLAKALFTLPITQVVNVGVAGAYDKSIELGSVVTIECDTFADYGADDKGSFLSQFDLGLASPNGFPFINGWMHWDWLNTFPAANHFPLVKGVTVAKSSGSSALIEQIEKLYTPQVETMESAAVFYACLQAKVPFLCLRSISNWVEPRNRERWDMPLAISNLAKAINEVLVF